MISVMPEERPPCYTEDETLISKVIGMLNSIEVTAGVPETDPDDDGEIVYIKIIYGTGVSSSFRYIENEANIQIIDRWGNAYELEREIYWDNYIDRMEEAHVISGIVKRAEVKRGEFCALITIEDDAQDLALSEYWIKADADAVYGLVPQAGDKINVYENWFVGSLDFKTITAWLITSVPKDDNK